MNDPGNGDRPLIYVDNAVLSRLTDFFVARKLVLNPDDIDALDALSEDASVDLVTSEKTWQEVLNAKNRDQRVILKFLYRVMTKVPMTAGVRPLPQVITANGGRSRVIHPGNVMDPLLLGLSHIFDAADAEHIFQAASSGCKYFLTVDYDTILKRRDTHIDELRNMLAGMTLVSPSELIRDL